MSEHESRRFRKACNSRTTKSSCVVCMDPYDSREHPDSVNAKVMEDPRMKDMMDPKSTPFDGMRMFWGGFKSFVELSSGPVTAR